MAAAGQLGSLLVSPRRSYLRDPTTLPFQSTHLSAHTVILGSEDGSLPAGSTIDQSGPFAHSSRRLLAGDPSCAELRAQFP